jgi:hypothetical protein
VESKLVSMVRSLEKEAERILQEGKDQAAGIKKESESNRVRRTEQEQAIAKREAERLVQSSRRKTQEESERRRAESKAALDTLLHRAEARLDKASRLILDRLEKL